MWYLALEEKRSEVRKHFRLMGADGTEPIRLFIKQAPQDIVPQLRRLADSEPPALIVIDTSFRRRISTTIPKSPPSSIR